MAQDSKLSWNTSEPADIVVGVNWVPFRRSFWLSQSQTIRAWFAQILRKD